MYLYFNFNRAICSDTYTDPCHQPCCSFRFGQNLKDVTPLPFIDKFNSISCEAKIEQQRIVGLYKAERCDGCLLKICTRGLNRKVFALTMSGDIPQVVISLEQEQGSVITPCVGHRDVSPVSFRCLNTTIYQIIPLVRTTSSLDPLRNLKGSRQHAPRTQRH